MTGIFRFSARCGIKTSDVTSSPCAAASWPVAMTASVPKSCARLACFTLTTVAKTLPPYLCASFTIQSPLPRAKLMTGTFSCKRTFAFSAAPGNISDALAPKGLSVSFRISRMDSLVCSAFSGPVARMPNPPALDTAATIFGVLIQLMPESTMGYLMPTISVILVFIFSPFYHESLLNFFHISFRRALRPWRNVLLLRLPFSP